MAKTASKPKMSDGAKIALVFAGLGLTAGTIYLTVQYFKKKRAEREAEEKRKQEQLTQTTDGGKSTTDQAVESGGHASLPKGGIGCGQVRTDHDMMWDYVKCDGVWYGTKKTSDNWFAITPDTLSTENYRKAIASLAKRYPND